MAEIIFVAHDPGGAQILGASISAARMNGHNIRLVGAGPAVTIWVRSGLKVAEVSTVCNFGGAVGPLPDLFVTGSGTGEFERSSWQWARAHACPAITIIDSWTNLARRFETPNGFDFPDAIGVIDSEARIQLLSETGCRIPIYTIGQSHLLKQTAHLKQLRSESRSNTELHRIAFVSEPIDKDYGRAERDFDQFDIFEQFCRAFDGAEGFNLDVKPHPRECNKRWAKRIEDTRARMKIEITLCEEPIDQLLAKVDGVVGMTSMVLLEAHLLGIPILSIQLGRTQVANPVIEDLVQPILHASEIFEHLATFLGRIDQVQNINPRFSAIMYEADKRTVAAMETLVGD